MRHLILLGLVVGIGAMEPPELGFTPTAGSGANGLPTKAERKLQWAEVKRVERHLAAAEKVLEELEYLLLQVGTPAAKAFVERRRSGEDAPSFGP